jgi:hypothetical protein
MDEDRTRKARLEMNIVSAFLPLYNHATGASLTMVRHGMPPEPDILCQDTVTSLFVGIEVVTVYHDDTHAKSVWAVARGKPAPVYSLTKPDSIEEKRILARALREIRKQARKSYEGPSGTMLLVQLYPWRFHLSDVEEAVATLRIPRLHPFRAIHLASQHEIARLYPHFEWISS